MDIKIEDTCVKKFIIFCTGYSYEYERDVDVNVNVERVLWQHVAQIKTISAQR